MLSFGVAPYGICWTPFFLQRCPVFHQFGVWPYYLEYFQRLPVPVGVSYLENCVGPGPWIPFRKYTPVFVSNLEHHEEVFGSHPVPSFLIVRDGGTGESQGGAQVIKLP